MKKDNPNWDEKFSVEMLEIVDAITTYFFAHERHLSAYQECLAELVLAVVDELYVNPTGDEAEFVLARAEEAIKIEFDCMDAAIQ